MPPDGSALQENENLRFLALLRERLSPEVFSTWCKALRFERPQAGILRVLAPNTYYRDWLEKAMRAPIEDAFATVQGKGAKVFFEVRESRPGMGEAGPAAKAGAREEAAAPGRRWIERVNAAESTPETGTSSAQAPPKPARQALSRLGYAEANFTRLPFALVNDKEIRTAKEIVIDVTMRSPAGLERRVWRVTSGKSGMPGPFDHGVFRALERHALDNTIRRGLPLKGPVYFHLKTITEMLGLYYNNTNIKFISNAFDRLQELSIEDVNFLRRAKAKGRKARGTRGKIHLVDQILAAGEMIRDNSSVAVSGTYAVTFGAEYEASVNARYVRPLDWELWSELSRPTGRRLVEILDMDFYGLRNGPHVAYEYSELCRLIPVRSQKFLSKARDNLDPAHEELVSRGYLTYEWETKQGRLWRILYKPGPRYWAFQRDLGHGITIGKVAQDLAAELGEPSRGAFYQQIVDRTTPDYINEALQDLRASVRENHGPENKAAWFLGALKAILAAKGLDLFPLI